MGFRRRHDRPHRIAVVMLTAADHERAIWRGIRRYLRMHSRWTHHWFGCHIHGVLRAIRSWRPDGLLVSPRSLRLVDQLRRLGKPMVLISDWGENRGIPRVDIDDVAVGRMAAEYFLGKGFRHFAYVGSRNAFSLRRESGFRNRLKSAGLNCASCLLHSKYRPDMPKPRLQERQLQRMLIESAGPLALLTNNDVFALEMEERCFRARLRVPEDVAILGVDNAPTFCEIANVPISSIRVPHERAGHEAASLLDRMLRGRPAPKKPILLKPLSVVTRQSSDMTAVGIPCVTEALHYMRAHLADPIGVGDVAAHAAVGRRTLERHFRETLGTTVQKELERMRIEQAKNLLLDEHLKIHLVARRCGFASGRRLDEAFRRATGTTPGAFRTAASCSD